MKTKKTILMIVTVIALYSCEKNNELDPTENSIEGVWKFQSLFLENKYDINGDGVATKDLMLETNNCLQNQTYEFLSNGTGVFNSVSYFDKIELLINSSTNKLEYSFECVTDDPYSELISWSQTDNNIVIEDDIKLKGVISGSTITIVIDNFVIESERNGNIIDVNETLTLVLTKQNI
ncbi:hypothetical protein H3Z83_12520 [Tenacibaculum sp. S7007]|uniref:Lipocalin-like domain-containing protein n=1 Tax=Tenacibaculum pelagium TaxID=2759527 RepID=A0A839ATA8_9FLAO|nr:hypothetical protein [Tenacibaculum pelagium]MBA6157334.1 hypothetical protein [Tenacibaculum pelagium]